MKLIDPNTGQSYTTIGVARKKPFPNGMEFHFLFNDLTRYLISCDLELTGAKMLLFKIQTYLEKNRHFRRF